MHLKYYRELIVWQKSMDLVVAVYALTRSLPVSEKFGLAQQLQRAVISVPSNIAEGHQRRSSNEYLHFLSIARGSLAEMETQLMLLQRLQYKTAQETLEPLQLADQIGRMLRAIARQLQTRTAPRP